MPRLPSWQQLGNPAALNSGRGVHPIGKIDTGASDVAKGVAQFGAGVDAMLSEQGRQDDATDLARAQTNYTQQMLDLDRRFENDTNPDTYEERFRPEAERIREEAAGNIRNPRARDLFYERQGVQNERYLDRTLGRGRHRQAESSYSELDNTLGSLSSAYVDENDPVRRDIIRQNILEHIDLGERSGLIPEGRIRSLRDRYIAGTFENDALRYAERNPYAALLELQEGDPRATTPSSGQVSEQGLAFLRSQQPRPATPQARTGLDRRLRNEAGRVSSLITENVTAPLTQAQHDALVSYGVRAGPDALHELFPMVNTGEWAQLGRTGNLTVEEQPSGQQQGSAPSGRVPLPQASLGEVNSARSRRGLAELSPDEATDNAQAIVDVARGLGIQPSQLAGIIHRETAGTMSPDVMGGYGGRYRGLIQFSPENAQRYGVRPGMSFREQLEGPVKKYLEDRFRQSGLNLQNADTEQVYAAILAGDPRRVNAADINGSARDAAGDLRSRARRIMEQYGISDDGQLAQRAPNQLPTTFNEHEQDMLNNELPSSRFSGLSPERRRALTRHVREALLNETRIDVEDDLARMRRTGDVRRYDDGTTSFDRAQRVLVPNQAARLRTRVAEAHATFQALAGLSNMTETEAANHIANVGPAETADGESYSIAGRVQTRAQRAWDRIADLRQRDPARAVSGGRLAGQRTPGAGSVQIGPDGNPITPPEDDDLTLAAAPEVRGAYELLRRRHAGANLIPDADGNFNIVDGQPSDTARDAWRTIFRSRLAAQQRLEITDARLLTRTEAQRLLDMPAESNMSDRDFDTRYRAAVDRAYRIFGPEYGARAVAEALGFRQGTRSSEAATQMRERLIRGDPLSEDALTRYANLARIDREEALWRFGGTTPMIEQGGRALELGGLAGITSPDGLRVRVPNQEVPAIAYGMNASPGNPFAGTPPNRPYTGPARRAAASPTAEELDLLRQFPGIWQEFERKFGAGSAATYLRGTQ